MSYIQMEDQGRIEISTQGSHCDFRPQLFYQEIQSWHIVDGCLDFKMNLSTGVNQARYPSSIDLENGPSIRLNEAITSSTKILVNDKNRPDSDFVSKLLLNAATWGDSDQIAYLLRSCFVTTQSALPAMEEACRRGFTSSVKVLLDGGLSPTILAVNLSNQRKNFFHVACESGQEECAVLLLSRMTQEEAVTPMIRVGSEQPMTAFECLRLLDLHGMARRLEMQLTQAGGVLE